MEFSHLSIFLMVASEKSFSRAAQKLLRTQPAVSLAVQRLEAELGEKLLDRSLKDGTLTDAGKIVYEYAHQFDVTVEGELGVLAGIEDEVSHEHSNYTDPAQVEDFVKRTGVDSLAISIGTSHGAFKFKVKPGESAPPLRFDILEECERRIPGFPIVLHGASSVLTSYIDMINKYGGKMENAVGVSADQLRKAAKSAVCKINIDSDGRLVMTAVIRKVFAEKPGEFDPRKYLGPAREELIKMYMDKNQTVLGSAGRV